MLAVANLVSKDSSRVNWSYYVLDATVGDAVVCAATREATCTVSLIDADGKPVSVDRFDPRNDLIPGPRRRPIRTGVGTVSGDASSARCEEEVLTNEDSVRRPSLLSSRRYYSAVVARWRVRSEADDTEEGQALLG